MCVFAGELLDGFIEDCEPEGDPHGNRQAVDLQAGQLYKW
jgi:hypothetical protein